MTVMTNPEWPSCSLSIRQLAGILGQSIRSENWTHALYLPLHGNTRLGRALAPTTSTTFAIWQDVTWLNYWSWHRTLAKTYDRMVWPTEVPDYTERLTESKWERERERDPARILRRKIVGIDTHCVEVLDLTRHQIGHFGDVLPSQSVGTVKKVGRERWRRKRVFQRLSRWRFRRRRWQQGRRLLVPRPEDVTSTPPSRSWLPSRRWRPSRQPSKISTMPSPPPTNSVTRQ